MIVHPIQQRGRKQRVGRVCFDGDRLAFFAGYNDCASCGVRGKVLLSVDDAREFGRHFKQPREPLGARLARKLAQHYGI